MPGLSKIWCHLSFVICHLSFVIGFERFSRHPILNGSEGMLSARRPLPAALY